MIFYGKEISVLNGEAYLNKWIMPSFKNIIGYNTYVQLPISPIKHLILLGILEENTGNFDTGEINYIFNSKYYEKYKDTMDFKNFCLIPLMPIIRDYKINKIIL